MAFAIMRYRRLADMTLVIRRLLILSAVLVVFAVLISVGLSSSYPFRSMSRF
jgi:hypothetical protein